MNAPSERTNALERDLLSLAVNKPEAAEIVATMAPASWQNPVHTHIAKIIKELLARGETVTISSVGAAFGDKGIQDWFGGNWAAFTDCFSSETAILPASAMKNMIEEEAAKRKMQHGLTDAQRMLDDGHNVKDVAERIAKAQPAEELTQADEVYQPFPVDVLPANLRTFVNESATSIGCDTSFIALPVLTAMASAIGSHCQLEFKPGWKVKPILWCAVVGESGTVKTPAFNLVLKPWYAYQVRCFDSHIKAMEDYAIAKMLHERTMQNWKREKPGIGSSPPLPPSEPQAQRILVDDPTLEALAPILLANPRGLLLAKDELSGWFGSFNRYSSGKGSSEESRYLSMYNGQPFTIDRKTGQPRTIHVPHAYLSICGGIQPGVLLRIWGQEHRQSGMAARFLVAYPPRKPKVYSEAIVDPATQQQWERLAECLFNLKKHPSNEILLRLSPEAKARAVAWLNQHNQEQAAQTGDMAAAFSKLEENPFRLAIVLHLAHYFSDEVVSYLEVNLETIESAITLTEWFKNEASRIYRLFGCKVQPSPQQVLLKWVKEQGEPVTPRVVAMNLREYRGSGGSERARVALESLVSAGLCERDEQGNYLPTRQHDNNANNSTLNSVGVGSVGTPSDLPQAFNPRRQQP